MGVVASVLRLAAQLDQHFPPQPRWSTSQMPDLNGKVMIVTGSNTGIGKDTIQALLEHDAKVYMASRNEEKAKAAIKDLKQKTGKEAIFLKLDLADLKSVKEAAEEYMRKEKELHVLFNNGGVMMSSIDQLTTQGYDLQFGTNVIGHFYFTKLLLPVLLSTAESTGSSVRVVNTASSGHTMYPNLDFNSFKDGKARRRLGKIHLYGQSKFGNIVFSNELARRYGDKGIVSTSLHPGNLRTELPRHLPAIVPYLAPLVAYPSKMGALTQLWAGTTPDPEGKELNGKYLVPWARIGKAMGPVDDEKLGKDLWEWLEEHVKDF
ncbi:NAD(P)-binding protein [Dendrothele bispora CBS 962.96]|uniref:NAD(P)-binding protein n=1 Tax=Dendrothele bispora (strain CBS 962.96) TaxID=1314807 RepID=A0A4S8LZI1_DENBC|nr:NAD(P)-binding protein [Dendrothele bispora CBS 962.96]